MLADMDDHLHDPEKRRRWKKAVLMKGQSLATALEKLMSGLEVRLDQLGPGLPEHPSRSRIQKLRAWLDDVDRIIKSFDGGTYGTCPRCGETMSETELDELPWRSACGAYGLG